jgi:hypothetical protein
MKHEQIQSCLNCNKTDEARRNSKLSELQREKHELEISSCWSCNKSSKHNNEMKFSTRLQQQHSDNIVLD